ncbi:MAG: S24 family peptidase [Rikenellaceae bacterium]
MRRKVIVPNNRLLDDVAAMISSGEQVTLLTKGQSMLPFIVGSRDSVELSPITEVKLGDIVLAKLHDPNPRYVIHRVICIEGERITLMGDGNIIGKEYCNQSDIIARVTSIIKPHKRINPYSKSMVVYSRLWQILRPIRRYLLAIIRRLS